MDELVNKYFEKAKAYGTFYGGKKGYDLISINKKGEITGSGGTLKYRLEQADRLNEAVAILIPVKFVADKMEKSLTRKQKESLVIKAIGFYEESPEKEKSIAKVPTYSDEKLEGMLEIVRGMYPNWFEK